MRKPIGWRGESYRHYLAAKGIRTRYAYRAFKEDQGFFKIETVIDLDKEVRRRNVQQVADEAMKYLERQEEENKMNSEWTERFMQSEFKNFADRYMSDQLYTRKQFQDDVRRKMKRYAQVHSGKLKVFDWGE